MSYTKHRAKYIQTFANEVTPSENLFMKVPLQMDYS